MRVTRNVVVMLVGILLATLFTTAPAGAIVIKPTVSGFSSSTTTLYKTGGTITLSATVANATSCVFSSNKTITGMPYTAAPCDGLVSHDVTLPANTGKKSVKYTFKLSATGAKKVNAKPVVTVTVGTDTPPAVGVAAISAGGSHTCALMSGGTVQCWGDNTYGELGIGTSTGPQTCGVPFLAIFTCSTTPVTVTGLSGVTAIATGESHTCALLSGGTVECWGRNVEGQLGSGSNAGPQTCNVSGSGLIQSGAYACSTTPVTVTGLFGVTAISAGELHTCALLSGGTVECWGYNVAGQLGNGTSTGPETCGTISCSTTPVMVTGLSGVMAVSAGFVNTCALISDGTVKCWGYNFDGELGNGTSTGPESCLVAPPFYQPCSTIPVTVGGLSGVTAISVAFYYTCALLSGGTVQCWGRNDHGQLGNGTSGYLSSVPVTVAGLSGAIAISTAANHTCALISGGTVQCWGFNPYGQLGNGTTTDSNVPVSVTGLTGVIAIAAGGGHTCALVSGGTVKCWGINLGGQLGNGTNSTSPPYGSNVPVPVSGL